MKTLTSALNTHLSSELLTLATCWKITRTDNVVLAFTDHDQNLVVDGVTYIAETGMTPTAISSSSALNVDDLDVEGVLDSVAISEEDLLSGLYDHATIQIFMVNYEAPGDGKIILRRGTLGEVTLMNQRFLVEVRGMTQPLSQRFGNLYSPSCRAQLGDSACKVNLASYTVTGSVTSVTSNSIFTDASRTEENGYFSQGVITFTSGNNSGLSMEIKSFSQDIFTLVLPLPYDVEVGDDYSLTPGCNKTLTTCKEKFGNIINFRGEPHVPGTDKMLETSSTRSEE